VSTLETKMSRVRNFHSVHTYIGWLWNELWFSEYLTLVPYCGGLLEMEVSGPEL